jgi:hypothetical protein
MARQVVVAQAALAVQTLELQVAQVVTGLQIQSLVHPLRMQVAVAVVHTLEVLVELLVQVVVELVEPTTEALRLMALQTLAVEAEVLHKLVVLLVLETKAKTVAQELLLHVIKVQHKRQ